MTPMDSEVTWSKVKVKLLILLFAQYFLPLFWKVPKLGSVDVPSEYMTYFNVQVTWSEVKLLVFVQILSAQYLLTPLLKNRQTRIRRCHMRVDVPYYVKVTWSKDKVKLLV